METNFVESALGLDEYTKWLVNTNLFNTNFTNFYKSSHSSLNSYYETEIPSLTRISLHVVLTNLVNTNFSQNQK